MAEPTELPKPRKRYQKPEAVRVPLRPSEAVLGACKILGDGGPVSGDCTTCNTPGS